MSRAKEVLAAAIADDLWMELGPALGRAEFELNRVPSLGSAIELVPLIGFDVVLVGISRRSEPVQELLRALRAPDAASRAAQVVFFAPEDSLGWLNQLVDGGSERALSSERPRLELQEAVLGLLRAKPRVSLRVMARLTVRLGEGTARLLCQTRDLSRSGMLAVTDNRYPIGTAVRFGLDLPGRTDGIEGDAEVVRHALRGQDSEEGLGLRFSGFSGDGERKLYALLEQHGG